MKKKIKILLTVMVVLMLVVSSVCSVYAERENEDNNRGNSRNAPGQLFKDVNKDFWGYQAIMDLAKLGIINGYTDHSFKPDASVTRSEFATMLTKALKLTPPANLTQTFADVAPSSWDYNAVEASKDYLTGYRTSNGTLYFYGSQNAVREDMAVALVKSLNLALESDNGQLQQVYSDFAMISPNLDNYVYTAYKDGIMIGSNGKFEPQGDLTRAEAATLLERALQKTEKIPVDGSNSDGSQKIVVDNPGQGTYDTNSTLSNLAVNGITISGFNATTYAYSVVLPAGTTAIPSVTASVYDTGKATSVVTQASSLPGTATVVVTAQDGVTKSTYSVNFTVATTTKDTDATLSSITVNGIVISGFGANTYAYNVMLMAGTTAIPTVAATVHDTGKATASIVQATGLPGTASITVTAEDGTTQKVYTVYFTM